MLYMINVLKKTIICIGTHKNMLVDVAVQDICLLRSGIILDQLTLNTQNCLLW